MTVGEPVASKVSMDSIHQVQLAVRPNGTLDAVWRQAPKHRIVHASSSDGGATFSKVAPIADEEEKGTGELPSLTATAKNALLVAWATRGNVFVAVHSSDKWSAARPLGGRLPDGVRLTHPAVAATADALWVMAYLTEPSLARVRVVLYRSADGGTNWEEHATLATRKRVKGERWMAPGDYVGLAAAKGKVYAAYVLPGEGKDEEGEEGEA